MADKDFGVKRIELIGSSGTPNLTSPTNLNLNAVTVAISTDVTIGGKVQSNVIVGTGYSVGIGSTQPSQAVDINETVKIGNIQISSGIVTASSGIVTYYGDASNVVDGRWVLGANETTDYTFTGIGFTQTTNDPILYLARGRVYEFVNNSGGAHPFQIRVSDGGAAYNQGVSNNGSATGIIRFEVPFNAPNTLYYQCTSHSGMGNTISVYPSTI